MCSANSSLFFYSLSSLTLPQLLYLFAFASLFLFLFLFFHFLFLFFSFYFSFIYIVYDFVMKQLRYTGMLEATRIRREGYPWRMPFDEFFTRYRFLAYRFGDKKGKASAATCGEVIATALKRFPKSGSDATTGWLMGKTLVFMKYWLADHLLSLVSLITASAIPLQNACRAFLARRRVLPLLERSRALARDAEAFLQDLQGKGRRINGLLEQLADEDQRRSRAVAANPQEEPPSAPRPVKRKKEAEFADTKAMAKDAAKGRKDVNKWWTKYERHKAMHCDSKGVVYPWFHGLIDRNESENLLHDTPEGTFIVRVSERFNGYVVSFSFRGRARHYKIVPSANGGYEVQGSFVDFGTIEELVEYYQTMPLDVDDNDKLVDALVCTHDLGLGIEDDIDDENHDTAVSGRPQPVKTNVRPRLGTTGSTRSLVKMRDSDLGNQIPRSEYVRDGTDPAWLRGTLTRELAEAELRARGKHDGIFLVREKMVSSSRLVFVLSMCYQGRFRHHLLERRRVGEWTIDNGESGSTGTLNDLVESFHKDINPHLGCVLIDELPKPKVNEPPPIPTSRRPMSLDPSPAPPVIDPSWIGCDWEVEDVLDLLHKLNMSAYARTRGTEMRRGE